MASLFCSLFSFFAFIFVGEWDCSDGSDEQRLFIMNHLSAHNAKLMNITELKQQCDQQYRSDNTPFSDICNASSEYPCFRTDTDAPLNITRNRPPRSSESTLKSSGILRISMRHPIESCVKPHFPTTKPMKSLQQSGVRESYGTSSGWIT